MDIEFVTCTYRPDVEHCRLLCDSFDQFVPYRYRHTLIVPRRDMALFSPLARGRRRVVTAEGLLPRHMVHLPFSEKWWLAKGVMPLRGWYVQQLLKLAAAKVVEADVYINMDSDIFFIRPFDESLFVRDGRVRLYHQPGAGALQTYTRWHESAAELLGLPAQGGYLGSDYIGSLVAWRTKTVKALHRHIETGYGKPWQSVLASRRGWSECILYGAFVQKVLADKAHHFEDSAELTRSSWDYDVGDTAGFYSFVTGLQPHHITAHIQSFENLYAADRRRLYSDFRRAAEGLDKGLHGLDLHASLA